MIRNLVLCLLPVTLAAEPVRQEKFLSNGEVKIGVDMASGGSIFWFSEVPADRNLLNHFDRGRFIQQSYYGQADGSNWGDKPWCWNPVQGGDYKGKPARVVESEVTETQLHVKSIPVNWAGGEELDECRMEEWITLRGKIAEIRFRFTYSGKTTHPAKHQELPAVFMDHALSRMVCYTGDKPWTGEPIKNDVPGWPNEYRDISESWAGYIGADGRGLGVHFPGTKKVTCYRYEGPDGPAASGCSYFAPIQTLAIAPGFTHDYTIHLTIGTPEEMRARFGVIRKDRIPAK
ncbi:MAG: hypothetical protein V4689_09235 [Verrucomicrobiota bacterium]